jgi:mevalonate kinase
MTKLFRLALIIAVTAGIFYISAAHIISVAEMYGNKGVPAYIYPLSIDGVIMISALTLILTQGAVSKEAKMWARFGRYFGFAVTIYANMEHSGYGSAAAVIINTIPAVSLIITMEITIHSAKAMARQQQRKQTRTRTDNVVPMRKAS